MGTYYIPRNLKGESRFLYIFTMKSLITTGIGGACGVIFYLIIGLLLGQTLVGLIILAIFALIGYLAGTIKIPTLAGLDFTKKVGGESIDEIIVRYAKFRSNRKLYTYTKEEGEK